MCGFTRNTNHITQYTIHSTICTWYLSFFLSTQKRLNCDKTDFATKKHEFYIYVETFSTTHTCQISPHLSCGEIWNDSTYGKISDFYISAHCTLHIVHCTLGKNTIYHLLNKNIKNKLRFCLTLFYSVFLVLILLGGAQICPHPLKLGGNGWKVPKMSWNLISYRDWWQTKGFTPFRHLEPP